MPRTLDFETAEAGTPIEGISIPALTRVTLARFAGAVDDYNALHLDDKVAQAAGKNSVYAPSTLVMAYMGRMIEQSMKGTSVRRFGVRVLKLLWPGDVLTCRGAIVEARKEGTDYICDIDVWCDNQRGETVAKGRILAAVPKESSKGLTKASSSLGLVYQADLPEKVAKKKVAKKKVAKKKVTKKKA